MVATCHVWLLKLSKVSFSVTLVAHFKCLIVTCVACHTSSQKLLSNSVIDGGSRACLSGAWDLFLPYSLHPCSRNPAPSLGGFLPDLGRSSETQEAWNLGAGVGGSHGIKSRLIALFCTPPPPQYCTCGLVGGLASGRLCGRCRRCRASRPCASARG